MCIKKTTFIQFLGLNTQSFFNTYMNTNIYLKQTIYINYFKEMFKMKKKFKALSLVLLSLLIFGLVGCGSNNNTTNNANNTTNNTDKKNHLHKYHR